MKIVVIGGTGLIGSKLVSKLHLLGHEAVAASPDTGVNTLTGEGLADVLDGADVVVDFTTPETALDNIRTCLDAGVHAVVGTSGFDVDAARTAAEEARGAGGAANVLFAPNFAIGAVLMMRFAEQAAKLLGAAEIVELHHDGKKDAPSGTALTTARRIAAARGGAWTGPGGDDAHPGARGTEVDGVRIHAVRLPGLLAHQEVILGGPGQTLTIRHDSTDRSSFMPGVLMAVRAVGDRPGLTVGLDALLDP